VTSDLDRRLEALAEAVELADGRLDPDRVAAARAVVGRAGARLGLDLHSTVAALAGATGSGKSSILNALVGAHVSAVGVRRPTTSAAVAAVWGDGGGAILDWLDVPRRHRVADGPLDGLVVLDLPDSDSLERSHRLQAERLIALVDLLVWVVDPQKYADAALHERYLRPLATHEDSMLVVLNQADVMAPAELEACRADLRRLLAEDGLAGVPILVASARTGDGLAGLREALAERVASRRAAATRLSADVTAVAAALAADSVDGEARRIRDAERERLVDALADAAGVPTVTRAVARAHRARGALATGWPFLRWLGRLRPDALRRLHLGGGGGETGRTSLPGPSPVQRARVTRATRELAAKVSRDLPAPWPALVRSAATAGEEDLPDQLDRAVARTELPTRAPRWWQAARFLQALLAAVTVAGALWLLGLAALGYVQLGDVVPTPEIGRFPLPTLLLGGGILVGLALAALARLVNRLGARRRARTAARALRREVETVASENVIGPVERELDAYDRLRTALETARGKRGRRPGGSLLRRGDGGLRRPLARSAGRPA
jgi:predicted GTPase